MSTEVIGVYEYGCYFRLKNRGVDSKKEIKFNFLCVNSDVNIQLQKAEYLAN